MAVILGLCFVVLTVTRPQPPSPVTETTTIPAGSRQQVMVIVIDTHDAWNAHGMDVQNVIQQQCASCLIRQIDLRGDLSMPSLLRALQQVDAMRQTTAATTTLLVNLSLGTYTYDDLFHAMVRKLVAAEVIMIASAGNDATTKPFYPAAFPEVLGVCSSTWYSKTKAAYSNAGSWVKLCAPGEQAVRRPPLQPEGLVRGTSFASPMVAGALGQILLEAPCVPAPAAVQALLRTAGPLREASSESELGAGILDASAASHYVRNLYACEAASGSFWQRVLARGQRFGISLVTLLGLLVYFVVSIFAVPFVIAYGVERYERRLTRRQEAAIQRAYADTAGYRCQRLLELKTAVRKTHKLRWHEHAELVALLDATQRHQEHCWWCDGAVNASQETEPAAPDTPHCTRCDRDVAALLAIHTTSRDERHRLPPASQGQED